MDKIKNKKVRIFLLAGILIVLITGSILLYYYKPWGKGSKAQNTTSNNTNMNSYDVEETQTSEKVSVTKNFEDINLQITYYSDWVPALNFTDNGDIAFGDFKLADNLSNEIIISIQKYSGQEVSSETGGGYVRPTFILDSSYRYVGDLDYSKIYSAKDNSRDNLYRYYSLSSNNSLYSRMPILGNEKDWNEISISLLVKDLNDQDLETFLTEVDSIILSIKKI